MSPIGNQGARPRSEFKGGGGGGGGGGQRAGAAGAGAPPAYRGGGGGGGGAVCKAPAQRDPGVASAEVQGERSRERWGSGRVEMESVESHRSVPEKMVTVSCGETDRNRPKPTEQNNGGGTFSCQPPWGLRGKIFRDISRYFEVFRDILRCWPVRAPGGEVGGAERGALGWGGSSASSPLAPTRRAAS
eukprot:SAG31_NODE_2915_length_4917_cov_3.609381_6_plen_188_part_00